MSYILPYSLLKRAYHTCRWCSVWPCASQFRSSPRLSDRTISLPNPHRWHRWPHCTCILIIICRWYSSAAKFGVVSEASLLQSDLESVYQWAEDNNAYFSNKKFEVVKLWTNDALKLTTSCAAPDGTLNTEKEHLRDLGITMCAESSFKRHIENMCQSAKNMCSWVLRTF